jgi:ABC-2 type transport system ATP-binding protein
MSINLPEFAVETIGLTKTYAASRDGPAKTALSSVDLAVPRGSIFGLLGPNGAGKSTLINILAGLVIKSGGTARVWGSDIETDMRRARSAIGVVPQEINLDAFFSPREVMETQAGMYGVPRRERRTMEILNALSLGDKADSYARSLSGGMRRRLLVAKAMVHTPPVLVLDEPTAGVDVELRQQLWSYFRELNEAGVTIMLTTHYLEEAQELCDQIAIIDHGKVVVCETTPELLGRLDRKELAITINQDIAAPPPELAQWRVDLPSPRRLVIEFQPSLTSVGRILDAVAKAGLEIADLTTEEADLEDIFLRLTGNVCAADEPTVMRKGDPQAETLAVTRSRPSP